MTHAEAFARIVGAANVVTDEAERRVLSSDIFFWADAEVADLVVRPADAGEAAAVVRAAADLNLALYTRGGGMSYTKGYVPTVKGAVLLDMRRVNALREVNPVDRYIVAEAGATWQQVSDALRPHGLKPVLGAPFSGNASTVGGALAQNVPSGMKGVLGLEVVRADGSVLRTGAWGRREGHGKAAPFYRDFGPDLTGLFLGDTGAFAVKTAAALAVAQKPPGTAHASFAYESYEDMAATLVDLGPYDFISRRIGLDPFKSRNAAKVGFKDALKTLGDVTATGSTLLAGLKDSVKMAAAGSHFMDGVQWSLHLSTDGVSDDAAEAAMDVARAACLRRGREIANLLPRAMDARGYSVRGFLGKDGQRWVPTNSIWPLSRAVEIAAAVQGFFAARRADMDKLGMNESYMTSAGPGYFMCEPSFYWQDEVSELHLRHLDADEAARFRALKPNLAARQYAMTLRQDLIDFFFARGALHVQLAKFYRYQDSLEDGAARLVGELKHLLDPQNRLNPGNLGPFRGG